MNKEKKLTDEEIVKALEMNCLCVVYGKENCESCLLFEKDCRILPNAVVDLIHRLQAENEQLKCDTYKTSWKGKFLEAKKEIERMAEKNNEIFQRYLNVIDKNNDLQNQVDKVEAEKEDLYRSNERLQKQVDELKARDMSEMRDLFNNETDRLIENAHQQAVKDTANEIFTRLGKRRNQGVDGGGFFVEYTLRLEDLTWFENRYGVEVE